MSFPTSGNQRVKYQPYKGYHHKSWLSYGEPYYPLRIKTKHDWQWRRLLPRHEVSHELRAYNLPSNEPCRHCQKVHCRMCGCWQPWKKYDKDSADANYEKRLVHRAFRRQTKDAIRRELAGDDAISHNFPVSGDWLD